MSSALIIFFSLFMLLFGAISYYIGIRTWQLLGNYYPEAAPVFWLILVTLTVAPLFSRLWRRYFPHRKIKVLTYLGAYWLASAYYALFLWAVADILGLIGGATGLWTPDLSRYALTGLTVWTLVLALLGYGTWNARRPVVTRYRVRIDKAAGRLSRLRAVLVSDIHLGPLVGVTRLRKMVRTINSLDPDIVFLAGDTIDEDVTYFVEQKMPIIFRELETRFGVFAVLGNHEYIGGHARQAEIYLQHAGINVLRDTWIKVGDSFYVAGRDDRMRADWTGVSRQPLPRVLTGVDRSLPVILLDHQPHELAQASQAGIDLQLSGHTHRGQFFPNNLITKRVFEIDWGHLIKDSFQIIVSSGYATWGPPIRIASQPEVVEIDIEFAGRPIGQENAPANLCGEVILEK